MERLTDTVDLPTPPLQLDIAITLENFFLIKVNVTFTSLKILNLEIFSSHSVL